MRYFVQVKFSRTGAIEVDGDELVVSVKSLPEYGKANRELIERISGHFGVHSSQVRIVSGFSSKKKIVEILEN